MYKIYHQKSSHRRIYNIFTSIMYLLVLFCYTADGNTIQIWIFIKHFFQTRVFHISGHVSILPCRNRRESDRKPTCYCDASLRQVHVLRLLWYLHVGPALLLDLTNEVASLAYYHASRTVWYENLHLQPASSATVKTWPAEWASIFNNNNNNYVFNW